MQFVAHGPDVPDDLLQAQEDGRVVFFCGAGISYPAKLPGFAQLVDKIYEALGTRRLANEDTAYKRYQYDATLDLLERRYPGDRLAIRRKLAKILQPDLTAPGASDSHDALLRLATSRAGAVRLVTTNFDRIFEALPHKILLDIPSFPAPLLPIPKSSRWHGIVYLHGLLPAKDDDDSALNRLVVTSGDFGLAYLTERWAARFVSELLRNYVVCFVGYSINDPVLRYMMDAHAADRNLGETTPQAYAFGDFTAGKEEDAKSEWGAKGVIPILYEVSATTGHSAIHRTLVAWAATYRDGVQGKESIISTYANALPSASTRQDDYVGRMLWALCDDTGFPARRFAEHDPVPKLDWLDALCEARYRHDDLPRFHVQPRPQRDDTLRFSLAQRPAPYLRSPWMTLVSSGARACELDDAMGALALWLTRHLDDPKLIVWLANQGGSLSHNFAAAVELRLEQLSKLEKQGKTDQLDRIRANAPNAIPRPALRVLWRLFLTGRVKSPTRGDGDVYRWKKRLNRDGVSPMLCLELRRILSPKIRIKEAFRATDDDPGANASIQQLVDCDLVLAADHVRSTVASFASSEDWRIAHPTLLPVVEQSLSDALDLMRELGEIDELRDHSYFDLPSISPHPQNRATHDWVVLIELLRDGWLVVREVDSRRAHHMAVHWLQQSHSTFKRLALFAATFDEIAPDGEWVEWLMADDARLLWSAETRRETMRLLVLQGHRLSEARAARLEEGIVAGPPNTKVNGDDREQREGQTDFAIWLRLAKLESSGRKLGDASASRIALLTKAHPGLKLAQNESDEFSIWMRTTGDADFRDLRVVDRAPETRRDLVDWLRKHRVVDHWHQDTWDDVCKTHPIAAMLALLDLATENVWPVDRWSDALHGWSDGKYARATWRFVAPALLHAPSVFLLDVLPIATRWVQTASKTVSLRQEEGFVRLCERLLAVSADYGSDAADPVMAALNHPVGHIAKGLIGFRFRAELNDNQGLGDAFEPLFTALSDPRTAHFVHGRVVLASAVVSLFRLDEKWAHAHLLPLFSWQASLSDARAAWCGFLWSPRLHPPLMTILKTDFIESAKHYAQLGVQGRQYASVLTYVALNPAGVFDTDELERAFALLPIDGLEEAAQSIVQSLESAGEQREEFWKHRVLVLWRDVWPKSRSLFSADLSEELVRLAIAARGEFPSAVDTFFAWFQQSSYPDHLIHSLLESGLCARFPAGSLRLLGAIVGAQSSVYGDLEACLQEILDAAPNLASDPHYQQLANYLRISLGR